MRLGCRVACFAQRGVSAARGATVKTFGRISCACWSPSVTDLQASAFLYPGRQQQTAKRSLSLSSSRGCLARGFCPFQFSLNFPQVQMVLFFLHSPSRSGRSRGVDEGVQLRIRLCVQRLQSNLHKD